MAELKKLRERIDETDQEILKALAKRMDIVSDILSVKKTEGLPVFDGNREKRMLEEAAARAAAQGLDPELVTRVLKVVIHHSRDRQARELHEENRIERIAYQGSEGAYSWITARRRFGEKAETLGFSSIQGALDAVKTGVADRALLPIENSLAGSIHEVYDRLAKESLHVVGEEVLRIEHCLIGMEKIPFDRIRRVVSHPMALQQCSTWLASLPGAQCRAYIDTAEAVAKVRRDADATQVAIASRQAADRYGLEVLKKDIADHVENYTRFWIIGRNAVQVDPKVPARTSLLLVTDHREGALVECLQALAGFGINMTKLESRPQKASPWRYSFYLDVEGNLCEERMAQALDRVRERARVLRVLGCYPRVQQPEGSLPPPVPKNGNGRKKKHCPSLHARLRRKSDTVVEVSGVPVGGDHPFVVMAGPCAVESRNQILKAAAVVKASGGVILRGGAYKPRTSPYSFQGLGGEGVRLLVEAGRIHGLPVVSEVLAPEQVNDMAERVDLLQVGARNMQNYPLLKELGRCHRPVLLKRGMSATLEELLHAAEYILSGGNQQVILCERGIRTFDNAMRSTLDLGAVVVLKERTHLPVVVDPSHAAGKCGWVPPLARAAHAAGCDGLIVEMHPEPERAKSDGAQALNPEQFNELMESME